MSACFVTAQNGTFTRSVVQWIGASRRNRAHASWG
jgi:hypothetical protein